ncbi:MAG: DUF4156 domain-containing protein [Porticoccaceae bacterium]
MNNTRIIHYTLTPILAALALSACTWVEPAEEAANVAVVEARHVITCERIGVTSASVKDRIGFINRSDRRVAEELATLAKNSAAAMGGDTLVASSEIDDGVQEFIVYRCN